jgi:hypothetical protein
MAYDINETTQTLIKYTIYRDVAPSWGGIDANLATQTLIPIIGRDGGDQVIQTITQEVFRRRFNSGFQNS